MGSKVNFYGKIEKHDEETRMVYGYASTTALDSQNEIVTKAAIEAALPEYEKYSNIREMHQHSAIGVAKSLNYDAKGLYVAAHIVDDNAWGKVKTGVYKGFSIGGKATSRNKNEITGLKLTEISLVDRPSNAECRVELWKLDDLQELEKVSANADTNAREGEEKTDEKTEFSANEAVKKGLYGVARLADILNQLNDLKLNQEWEEKFEQDDASKLPALLKQNVMALSATLKEMVEEETGELTPDEEAVQMAEKNLGLEKAGARTSKADMAHVQSMHDSSVALGADCSGFDADGEQKKAAANVDIAKLDEITDLAKALVEENTTLKKRIEELENTVMPAKGVQKVHAISKEDDHGHITKSEPEPTEPVDMIKKILGQGATMKIM